MLTPIIIGQRFGKLVVISIGPAVKGGRLRFCKCDCGNEVFVLGARLNSGNTTSCGCRRKEAARENGVNNRTHGLTRTPVGGSWQAMMNRCYNVNQPSFKEYGARGIIVCDYLRSGPHNLLALIGERPPRKTLDRENNLGSYTCGCCSECAAKGWPLNVRWATRVEQNRNRRDSIYLTIGESTKHIREWAHAIGMTSSGIQHRIRAGMAGQDLLKPSKCRISQ